MPRPTLRLGPAKRRARLTPCQARSGSRLAPVASAPGGSNRRTVAMRSLLVAQVGSRPLIRRGVWISDLNPEAKRAAASCSCAQGNPSTGSASVQRQSEEVQRPRKAEACARWRSAAAAQTRDASGRSRGCQGGADHAGHELGFVHAKFARSSTICSTIARKARLPRGRVRTGAAGAYRAPSAGVRPGLLKSRAVRCVRERCGSLCM